MKREAGSACSFGWQYGASYAPVFSRIPSVRLARSFVAKVVLGLATTAALIERLAVDMTLRRLSGWERAASVPGESTFLRAFAEFAQSDTTAATAAESTRLASEKIEQIGSESRDNRPVTSEHVSRGVFRWEFCKRLSSLANFGRRK